MKLDMLAARERQSQHDLMLACRELATYEGIDPSVLDTEFVRDFRTRALLEREALLQFVQMINEQHAAKPVTKRKAA